MGEENNKSTKNILARDSHFLGVIIGLTLPVLAFGVIYLVNLVIIRIFDLDMFMRLHIMKLLSIFINLIPLRYYFLISKLEQTGRGVLFCTFVYAVVYFSMY